MRVCMNLAILRKLNDWNVFLSNNCGVKLKF